MNNCKTFNIPASSSFLADGGATIAGFVPTGSDSANVIATVSGWHPGGGSHPTCMFVKPLNQNGQAGIWFRVNFVNDYANGQVWITFYQGGSPTWPGEAQPTSIAFNTAPWN